MSRLFKKIMPEIEGQGAILDLSNESEIFKIFKSYSLQEFEEYFNSLMQKSNTNFLIGKYGEDRKKLFENFGIERFTKNGKTLHAGIDIFMPVSSKVLLPVDAKLIESKKDPETGGYGHYLIYECNKAFLLFGHIEPQVNLTVGEMKNKGEIIAKLANIQDNGGYLPHLHFQVLKKDIIINTDGYVNNKNLQMHTIDPKEYLKLV